MIVLKELWKDATTTKKGQFVTSLFLVMYVSTSFTADGPVWWDFLNAVLVFVLFGFAIAEYIDLKKELEGQQPLDLGK